MSVRKSNNPITILNLFFFFLLSTKNFYLGSAQNNDLCEETRCGINGPAIRFPFRLKNDNSSRPKSDTCSYPGFDLFCVGDETALDIRSWPSPPNKYLFVSEIDYTSQLLSIYNPEICSIEENYSTKALRNISIFPYEYYSTKALSYTLFKCPTEPLIFPSYNSNCKLVNDSSHYISMLIMYTKDEDNLLDYVSCSKMYEVPLGTYRTLELTLPTRAYPFMQWSKPDCRRCEARGKGCRLKNRRNIAGDDRIECYDIFGRGQKKFSFVTAGIVVCSVFIILGIAAISYIYTKDKKEKENRKRIKKFLEDYKALNPSRYTYADIKKITNQFEEKLGEGAYGTVFKGKLSNDVFVAAKILNETFKDSDSDEFINEVSTMGKIRHVNIVRLVGYCADGIHRALIYEFMENDSLEKYIISSSDRSLDWTTLKDIAIGVAKGIEYLHQGCDRRILHFDIKPHNVLLDQNFAPKIADFGLAKLCPKDQSFISMTTARGTLGYIAPEVFSRNFGNVSYKSDVYSYGMLLLEMVGGRKNSDNNNNNTEQIYYPEWIYNLLEKGEDLRIQIDDENDAIIAKRLAIVGLWCIQWHPIGRPTMKAAVRMLEEGEELTMPPNPFASSAPESSVKIPARPLALELETIVE